MNIKINKQWVFKGTGLAVASRLVRNTRASSLGNRNPETVSLDSGVHSYYGHVLFPR